MQVFDQEVAPALAFTEQSLHFAERGGIDLPPLRMIRPAPPARARMDAAVVFYGCCHVIAAANPSPPSRGEREGPARSAGGWGGRPPSIAIAPTSPRPSPPQGAERENLVRVMAGLQRPFFVERCNVVLVV